MKTILLLQALLAFPWLSASAAPPPPITPKKSALSTGGDGTGAVDAGGTDGRPVPGSGSAASGSSGAGGAGPAGAGSTSSGSVPHACAQIEAKCKAAGFVQGDWKKGYGLWRDCVDPIVQGDSGGVPGATKKLPQVSPQVAAACRKERPKFGEGKVGSPASSPSSKPSPKAAQ